LTSSGASLISALARIEHRFADLAATVRSQQAVESAEHVVTIRAYATGDRVECYVDGALRSGNSIGAWLEFRWDGIWVIESSIRYDTDAGEDELVALATRTAADDERLIAELDLATDAVAAAVSKLNFGTL